MIEVSYSMESRPENPRDPDTLNLEDLAATESTTVARQTLTGTLTPPDNTELIEIFRRPSTWVCTTRSIWHLNI